MKYFETHRHATWLELFFDLVFVAAISVVTHQLGHLHHGHLEASQLALFPVAFVPVWWIWASHTLYANRFDRDSPKQRLAALAVMFLMVTMASALGENTFDHFSRLILFYVAIRLLLALLYLSVRRPDGDDGAGKPSHFARSMGLAGLAGAAISGLSLLFDSPAREIVFLGGIAVEMAAAVLISRRTTVMPVHRSHLVERIGLLSIIVLGESVISLVASLADITWSASSMWAASAGFLAIGAIWWIYFDSFDVLERTQRLEHGFVLLYSNVLFCMGLAILANLIHHAVVGEIAMDDYRLLAIVGLTLFYLGKQTAYFYVLPIYRPNILINSIVCLAITIASTFLPKPEHALTGMTVGLLFYVYSNLRWTLTKDATPYLIPEHE
ncbi:MAG: low temperature requirement protein A [Acidobacteriota bacterium]